MKPKSLIVVVLIVAAGTGAFGLLPRPAGGAWLVSEGFRVTGETVTQTVSTVGTLVPRESIVLVSELPRFRSGAPPAAAPHPVSPWSAD